ncbi:lysophospholipid acyltransferase LPEAT2-like isoform X1 [Primulina eburnea]|uniref:lysophospholipid acyltransferase LPEAT2-like isoform X1 n=1 Tax=Primulina eburnea TaxID=1245227 RepID=UPI003C6CAB33
MAADDSLSTPFLVTRPSDHHSHVVLDVNGCDNPAGTESACQNPFEFIGAHEEFEVPGSNTVDPFRNSTPGVDGVYEWLKIVICLPVAAVRLVLFGFCLMVGYVATVLALHGWKDKQNPLPRWRCRVMWVTRLCARAILFSFGYHWIKRRGKPASREIAPIVVSNHVSYIEPIFFFFDLFPTIVSSESHDSMPFVGTIIRAMQVIYVDRFSKSSRKHAVNEIKRKASSGRFPRVLLFPEGTTSNGRVLISFQLGAFIPGHTVQPVIVRYPHIHFDQSWGNIPLGKLMFRMFTQFHNFMEVEYLPVVKPNENRKENAICFAQRTSHVIASALNVPQTSHTYGDFMLFAKAAEFKQENPSAYMVEMAWVQSSLHLRVLEAVEFLEIYLSMNPDASGYVEFHNFIKVLRLKTSMLSEKIFGFIDTNKIGKITFKQFLLGSAHVLKQPLFRHACELAFSECVADGKNHISKSKLHIAISVGVPNLHLDEIEGLFSLFDDDSDGKISKNDFVSCLRRHPLLIALFRPLLLHIGSSILDPTLIEVL